jgi:nucleoside-diphosphate-sugar epimerase
MTKPKILVTGGAGYIGSHVVLALQELGYAVDYPRQPGLWASRYCHGAWARNWWWVILAIAPCSIDIFSQA